MLWSSVVRFFGTTAACVQHGHDVRRVHSDQLYYQKADQPVRYWFEGTYEFCARAGCDWARFRGNPGVYRQDRA